MIYYPPTLNGLSISPKKYSKNKKTSIDCWVLVDNEFARVIDILDNQIKIEIWESEPVSELYFRLKKKKKPYVTFFHSDITNKIHVQELKKSKFARIIQL